MQFLGKDLARTAMFQTIIFTSLRTDEVRRLRKVCRPRLGRSGCNSLMFLRNGNE